MGNKRSQEQEGESGAQAKAGAAMCPLAAGLAAALFLAPAALAQPGSPSASIDHVLLQSRQVPEIDARIPAAAPDPAGSVRATADRLVLRAATSLAPGLLRGADQPLPGPAWPPVPMELAASPPMQDGLDVEITGTQCLATGAGAPPQSPLARARPAFDGWRR